jgi:hypothetical protein
MYTTRRTNEALDELECPAIISFSYNTVWILLIAGKAFMLIHNSPPKGLLDLHY